MKFKFYVYEDEGNYLKITMTTNKGAYGEYIMLPEEWDALKAILIHGRTWFQRGEVEVLFDDQTSTLAFVEGGE